MPHPFVVRRALAVLVAAIAISARPSQAQETWQKLDPGSSASFRGLSIVNDRVIWVSGTRGTVLRTTDAGATWDLDTIPGAKTYDVRAISARSERVAHVAATAGRIWRTTDGGHTWSLRYQAADTTVFFDAIAFWDDRHGMALGDPIGGRFFLLITRDGGETWQEAAADNRPTVVTGEAAFAASGTSLQLLPNGTALIGSGGKAARVHRSTDRGQTWTAMDVPMQSGSGSNGIFSLGVTGSTVLAVGGDYRNADSTRAAAARSTDGGVTWTPARQMPSGYRSGVTVTRRGLALAVGSNGSDLSLDGGVTWTSLDRTGFNAVQVTPGGMAFAVGASGAVARLDTRHLAGKR
ncbi:MAG: hypothetical protein U0132_18550 [Gemmatimonadaceae bacterium]